MAYIKCYMFRQWCAIIRELQQQGCTSQPANIFTINSVHFKNFIYFKCHMFSLWL